MQCKASFSVFLTPPMPDNNHRHKPLTEETTMHGPSSLHSPFQDSIPSDLVEEILVNLPAKSLLRFKCVCKPWNNLISSPQFAMEHLRISTMSPGPSPSPWPSHHHVILSPIPCPHLQSLTDYTLDAVVNTPTATYSHRVNPFGEGECLDFETDSFHGMLLVSKSDWANLPILWNPSTGKFKTLPSLEGPHCYVQYGFGYDPFTDSYKVAAVSSSGRHDNPETYVEVHTLGTDSWRYIPGFPNAVPENSGIFVSGTLNWLVSWDVGMVAALNYVIASVDLTTETFRELLPPVGTAGDIVVYRSSYLGVLKGCLCLLCNGRLVCDIWVMKDYGDDESWTKLFSVPYYDHEEVLNSSGRYIKALWISDGDDEILLESSSNFVVYDHKNGTLKTTVVKRFLEVAQVYAETLISP